MTDTLTADHIKADQICDMNTVRISLRVSASSWLWVVCMDRVNGERMYSKRFWFKRNAVKHTEALRQVYYLGAADKLHNRIMLSEEIVAGVIAAGPIPATAP